MRTVQFRILTRILDKVLIPDYIHGFEKGRSIPEMARAHVGKDVVISLDIKDFFPSIKQFMVAAVLRATGIEEKTAMTLSELMTYKAYVPQGSLTAPKISNMVIAATFGPKIKAFCDELGISLTIYADDVTMSYSKLFENLEEAKAYSSHIITTVTQLVGAAGFTINRKKTKIMRPHNRQWVCGAVVNEKVNMRKKERLQLRALVHNCIHNGIAQEASKTNLSPEAFIRKYAGRINWLCQLNTPGGITLKRDFKTASTPFLRSNPSIQIPELAWNSSIEMPVSAEEFQTEVSSVFGEISVLSGDSCLTPPPLTLGA